MSIRAIPDFDIKIGLGFYENLGFIRKFGYQKDLQNGSKFPVWDVTGNYTFSDSADITKMASSDAGDTEEIKIVGLDENYIKVEQTKILQGKTVVTLDTPLRSITRAYNNNGTPLVGDVYFGIATAIFVEGVIVDITKIRAKINVGRNQTLMAIYTVEKGHTLYLSKWKTSTKKIGVPGDASMTPELMVREFGKVFRTRDIITISQGGGTSYSTLKYYLKVPEKSEVMILVDNDSAIDVNVAATFEGFIIKNN